MHENAWKFALGCFVAVARSSRLDDAFSGILQLKAHPVESQQLQQKDKYARKREKPKTVDLCTCPRKNVTKRDASGKKGMLSRCKCLF